MNVIGLDIGGANLKASNVDGRSVTIEFAIWKTPDRLREQLRDLIASFQNADVFAVTMTAELADCFATKAEGVDFILSAVEEVAGERPVFVWQTGAEFVSPEAAREIPLMVAAANWHALATFAGRLVPNGTALLIDIGTTTTDIIPLLDGVPVPAGLTDCERLRSGELVYSGVRRTPLCAIAHSVPFRDGYCPMAAEVFATALDIYVCLGEIPQDENDVGTANGRPATVAAAHDRLARMLCCDRNEFTRDDAELVSRFLADVQRQRLAGAMESVLSRTPGACKNVLIAGSGTFLARNLIVGSKRLEKADVVSLSDCFSAETSEAACAFAVARLAAERIV